jgi:ArsR family transcriptional regulator
MLQNCENKSNPQKTELLADFLRVISEGNRLRIICFLHKKERCVCEIWKFLDLPQNLVSHHLKVLKDFGLLNSRKDGLNVCYSINKSEIEKYSILLNKILIKKEGDNDNC